MDQESQRARREIQSATWRGAEEQLDSKERMRIEGSHFSEGSVKKELYRRSNKMDALLPYRHSVPSSPLVSGFWSLCGTKAENNEDSIAGRVNTLIGSQKALLLLTGHLDKGAKVGQLSRTYMWLEEHNLFEKAS
ncbi:hypothetical protein ACFE04_019736 [Oxalis oulophora]